MAQTFLELTINHPRYVDLPPMIANSELEMANLIAEVQTVTRLPRKLFIVRPSVDGKGKRRES